jgi:hypothetical protein
VHLSLTSLQGSQGVGDVLARLTQLRTAHDDALRGLHASKAPAAAAAAPRQRRYSAEQYAWTDVGSVRMRVVEPHSAAQ